MRRFAREVLAVCVVLLLCGPAAAADWYVDGNRGRDTNVGSAKKPFRTIQRAIDAAAASGDVVHVRSWTYLENLVVSAKSLGIVGESAAACVVDGSGSRNVVRVVGGASLSLAALTLTNGASDPSSTYAGGGAVYCEGSTLVIDGCVLSRNHAGVNVVDGYAYDTSGGAIYATLDPATSLRSRVTIVNSVIRENTAAGGIGAVALGDSSSVVTNNVFESNSSPSGPGALHCGWCSLDLAGNTFTGNQAGNGGAIMLGAYGNHRLTDNRFVGNTATNNGGAAYVTGYAGVTMLGNVFEGNSAAMQGGAVCTYNSSVTADGNVFRENSAGFLGGAVWHGGQGLSFMDNLVAGNSAPEGAGLYGSMIGPFLSNNTFVGNRAALQGAGVVMANVGTRIPRVTNSIFWDNLVSGVPQDLVGFAPENVTFNDIGDGYLCGTNGNICEDPLFEPGDANHHLSAASPCRDAGSDPSGSYLALDFEGDPRRLADGGDGLFDMGADEYVDPPPPCEDADGDGWTTCAGDCDDGDPEVNPGMRENGRYGRDGRDNDCNGVIDG